MIPLTLPRSLDAAGLARTAIAPVTQHLPEDRRADFNLLVSELVNNAVMHGSGRIELRVERAGRRCGLRCPTRGSSLEAVKHPRTGGWGLHLLDALAERWGMAESSTRLWFEVPVT
jgi:anti-sigma regulatory factor (Ser/Thr protein kinase)